MNHCSTPLSLIAALIEPLINEPILSEKCDNLLHSVVLPTKLNLGAYMLAFACTCLLEAPFYFYLLKKESRRKRIFLLISANLLTHPVIYFLLPTLLSHWRTTQLSYLGIAEVFAPIIEAAYLSKMCAIKFKKSLAWMILANLTSWWVGSALLN